MGLFDGLFGKKNTTTVDASAPTTTPAMNVNPSKPSVVTPEGLLNLKKNDILDLTKTSAHYNSLRLSAGWDINRGAGSDYDLDLFAILVNSNNRLVRSTNPCVYYGDKKAKGIELDHDNLTGEGEGDDENIFIDLTRVPEDVQKIVLCVAIYQAKERGQCFKYVENAYVRLVDTSNRNEVEICRYNLSDDGGDSTAVICAEIFRNGSEWSFKAVGEFTKGSISKIKSRYE